MMDGCKVISMSEKGGGKRFTIYRLDGRMIQKEKCIEFVSPNHNEDQWIEAFKEIGIYQKEVTKYPSSLSSEDDQVIYCILNGSFQLWNFFNVVTNIIFLLQPERKKSPNMFGKILKKKESSNQPSGEKDHDRIAREPQYLSAAKRYKPLIKIYMNILNVAFQDTTPKYIEKVLVKEVSILFSE